MALNPPLPDAKCRSQYRFILLWRYAHLLHSFLSSRRHCLLLSTSLPHFASAGEWRLLTSANPRILAGNDENDVRVARKKRPPRVCVQFRKVLCCWIERKLCKTITRKADRRKRSRVRRPINRKQPARIQNITHSNSGNIATDEAVRSHFVCFDYSLCINWLNTYISHLTNEPLFNY